MKNLLVILFLLFMKLNLFGQAPNFGDFPKNILEHLNKMGTESSHFLNGYESEYFNVIFKDSRGEFDFTEKKIGFITGSNGGTLSNKKEYFDKERDRLLHNYTINIAADLYVFNEDQKGKSGEYDAVIAYWCKVLLRIEDLPQKLK